MTEPTKRTTAKVVEPTVPDSEWKIQVSKRIDGDLWNIRAASAEEFAELVRGLAKNVEDSMNYLGDFIQGVQAFGVRTESDNRSSTSSATSGPPRCKHGEMKDLSSKGYRHRYYCPERSRANQCPPQD